MLQLKLLVMQQELVVMAGLVELQDGLVDLMAFQVRLAMLVAPWSLLE
jgi:hypothetical protein